MAEQKAPQAGKSGKAPAEPVESADDERPGYEEARAELIEVVRALEAGGTTLEESLALWERGERLAADLSGVARGRAPPVGCRHRGRRGLAVPATPSQSQPAAGAVVSDAASSSSSARVTVPNTSSDCRLLP